MKRIHRILLTIITFVLISGSSCETDNEWGPGISGTWTCQEESLIRGYRQYKVNIERNNADTSVYRVFNFHNLGFEIEVYIKLADTVITFLPPSSEISISGTGKVNKAMSDIYLEYSIIGLDLVENDIQAHYYRR